MTKENRTIFKSVDWQEVRDWLLNGSGDSVYINKKNGTVTGYSNFDPGDNYVPVGEATDITFEFEGIETREVDGETMYLDIDTGDYITNAEMEALIRSNTYYSDEAERLFSSALEEK